MSEIQIRLWYRWISVLGILFVLISISWAQGQSNPVVVKAAKRGSSPPLSQMAPLPPPSRERSLPDDEGLRLHTARATSAVQDAALQGSQGAISGSALPTNSGVNVLGIGTGLNGYVDHAMPPDTNGAVGPTQFVQWVNESFAVFNKSDGSVAYGPADGSTLWQALGAPCSSTNNLDGSAQFDKLANRWVMMMPIFDPSSPLLCVAVSTTSDATNAVWNLYAFAIPRSTLCNCIPMPDYPKLAVWPDAYYVTYNQGSNLVFQGDSVCALDRNSMLNGAAATMQCFDVTPNYGGLLPGDVDGTTPPPVGSPEYFLNFDYNDNALDLWQFHVDWTTPANSTFTGPANIPVEAFTEACGETVLVLNQVNGACIPQAGIAQTLDSYGDRVMYRLAYRNFTDHESLVVNHTVSTGSSTSNTGIRWYELQKTTGNFGLFQQGTFAPDSSYRWMGSIAMDKAGDIALGYSVSSSTMSPSIAYTGRVPSDPLNQMESEVDVLSAAGVSPGSQSAGSNRWGDYSSMAVDPSDDCTFWYTTEYQPTNGSAWSTRIASFSFPSCTNPGQNFTVNESGTGTGTVTSTPAGIDCPGQCSSSFPLGTSVTLTAAAASGSSFTGWSGPCSGIAACTLTVTSAQTVGAIFDLQDFTVTVPAPTTATVSPGGVATFSVAIGAVGGFNSAVTLTCSSPTSQGVNCSLSPTSAQPGASVSLTVTTRGPSAAAGPLPGTMNSNPLYALWIFFPALALVGIGSAGVGSKTRRLGLRLIYFVMLATLALQIACGSNGSAPKDSGTPVGTYTVNVTATSGTIQHTAPVSVTVQ